jgi:hypothetical protein
MNTTQKNMSHDKGNSFDRLVDGELSESERRCLLASLDAEPEGWRRCAFAFLEAQTWRESFGDLTHALCKPSILPTPSTSPPSPKKRKKPLGAMGTVMAMAASFLIALGLGGWIFHGPRGGSLAPPANMIVNNDNSPAISPLPAVLAGGDDRISPSTPKSPASTPWQMVQLRAPGITGNNEPLQLPALPRERLDENFLNTVPNPLPDDVRQAFERTGHEVHTHRELVPVQLKDGRQLIVPVDQVDVRYEGHRAN